MNEQNHPVKKTRKRRSAEKMAIVGHTQLKTTNGYVRKAGVEIKGWTEKLGYNVPSAIDSNSLQFAR